jgi:hypothetical protein
MSKLNIRNLVEWCESIIQVFCHQGAMYIRNMIVIRNLFFKLYKFSFERFWIKIEWESYEPQSYKTHNLTILGLLETNDHLNVTMW